MLMAVSCSKAIGLCGAGVQMERGTSEGEVWEVGGSIGVRGRSDGLRQPVLLLVGFRDGVKCSRSLLHGLPPSTHQ